MRALRCSLPIMVDEFLKDMLIKHEGIKLYPYHDDVGKITIGVGRNLSDMGITNQEANLMLDNDIQRCSFELMPYDWCQKLDPVRKAVLLELDFNIGISKLLQFKKMIQAIRLGDYQTASNELLNSVWAKQVGEERSTNMAYRLRFGRYV